MAAKKAKNSQMSITSGNMTFAGTSKQVNKMLEADLKAAIKRQSSKTVKENQLSLAERRKLSDKRLDKLDAERKKTKQKAVKEATPSYIKVKGGKYEVTKTSTGKIKVKSSTGGTVTFPKGTSIGSVAARLQEGQRMAQAAAKVKGAKISVPGKTTIKVRGGSAGRGGGAGGAFLENLK